MGMQRRLTEKAHDVAITFALEKCCRFFRYELARDVCCYFGGVPNMRETRRGNVVD